MQVFALREVVGPGEPILRLVSKDAGLLVRTQLRPIYVDQVSTGQEAVLRFSAFPSRTTPRYEGRILRVSADAARDERTGLSWYEVEVAMGKALDSESYAMAWLSTVADWVRELFPGLSDPACSGGGCEPCSRPRSNTRHAGRGAHPYHRALAPELSGQAADRLFFSLYARRVKMAKQGAFRVCVPMPL